MRELQDTGISDNRFSRFDEELINKYFNEKGKKAIQEYITSQVSAQVDEARIECMEYAKNLCTVNFDKTGFELAVTFGKRIAELRPMKEGIKDD